MLRSLRSRGKNKSSPWRFEERKRNVCSFAVSPQTAKVTATVREEGLVKMEEAYWGGHSHITFFVLHCYNSSILLLVIVSLLLCLIYKLYFTIGMCVYRKKHNISRVQYYPPSQASTGVLGHIPPQIRGEYGTVRINWDNISKYLPQCLAHSEYSIIITYHAFLLFLL